LLLRNLQIARCPLAVIAGLTRNLMTALLSNDRFARCCATLLAPVVYFGVSVEFVMPYFLKKVIFSVVYLWNTIIFATNNSNGYV